MASHINPAASRKAEILLIEDNASDVLLTRKAFEHCRVAHNLTVAKDGGEALAILIREGQYAPSPIPDLVLLDLHLPKMDGKELLEKIKAAPHMKNIPVIVLTGSYAETDVVKSYELNAYTYIVKPVNLKQQPMIEDILEKRIQS